MRYITIVLCLVMLSGCMPHHGPHMRDLSPTGDPVTDIILGSLLIGGVIASEIIENQVERNVETQARLRRESYNDGRCTYNRKCIGRDCECREDYCCADGFICMADGSCVEDPDDMTPKG